MKKIAFFCIFLILFISKVNSVSFRLDAGATKCLSEDVPKKELIVMDFSVFPAEDGGISVRVIDPSSTALYQRKDSTEGKFATTASMPGEYRACFTNNDKIQKTITFDLQTGVNARDYTAVAKKESLKPIEVELKRLEDLVKETHDVMMYLKSREEMMRNTNESTNARVLNFSLFSMFILVALGIWQVRHLRAFFKTKKLIN